ncbi:MAG: T9SS type A sorting domain-containing protein, partial [Candidatus Aegiribacteria sp.]|nr:T9SS type A sorting domain-containing protein [Candidatus Aegiribacteria sp.]
DLSGRTVQTSVNESQTTGIRSVNFDGSNLSSGVYFYQLKAGNEFVETRTMILMR